MFKLGVFSLLLVTLFSCSPSKRATMYIKRAEILAPELFKKDTFYKVKDTTIYIDTMIFIKGNDSIVFRDSIRTERTYVRVYKINDTCIATLEELPFYYNFKDSIIYRDTCGTHIDNRPILTENKGSPWYYFVITFLIGITLGLYIKLK